MTKEEVTCCSWSGKGQHLCPVTLAEPHISCEKWASLSFTPTSLPSPQIIVGGRVLRFYFILGYFNSSSQCCLPSTDIALYLSNQCVTALDCFIASRWERSKRTYDGLTGSCFHAEPHCLMLKQWYWRTIVLSWSKTSKVRGFLQLRGKTDNDRERRWQGTLEGSAC